MKNIGIISDTHGLLRQESIEALAGSDLIIHAGDIGNPEILQKLGGIAPVVAVRGNMDFGMWADEISETEMVEFGNFSIYVLHDLGLLEVDPGAALIDVVVSGHTHRPAIEQKDEIWYINPGSAGHRRFNLPVTLCRARLDGDKIFPEIIELSSPPKYV